MGRAIELREGELSTYEPVCLPTTVRQPTSRDDVAIAGAVCMQGVMYAGCTVAVAMIDRTADGRRVIYTANAGDARAVISRQGTTAEVCLCLSVLCARARVCVCS